MVRNASRAGKLMQRMGFGYSWRTWSDVSYMRRYMVAIRSQMEKTRSVGYSSDKSRGSGKDWLSGSCIGHEVKRICWCQPVVIPTIIKKQGPTSKKSPPGADMKPLRGTCPTSERLSCQTSEKQVPASQRLAGYPTTKPLRSSVLPLRGSVGGLSGYGSLCEGGACRRSGSHVAQT